MSDRKEYPKMLYHESFHTTKRIKVVDSPVEHDVLKAEDEGEWYETPADIESPEEPEIDGPDDDNDADGFGVENGVAKKIKKARKPKAK